MTGVVTRVFSVRGFGFVRDERNEERFLHALDMTSEADWAQVRVGSAIAFEPVHREGRYKGGNNLGVAKVRLTGEGS